MARSGGIREIPHLGSKDKDASKAGSRPGGREPGPKGRLFCHCIHGPEGPCSLRPVRAIDAGSRALLEQEQGLKPRFFSLAFSARLNRLRKNPKGMATPERNLPSGAKALFILLALSARLKPCPFKTTAETSFSATCGFVPCYKAAHSVSFLAGGQGRCTFLADGQSRCSLLADGQSRGRLLQSRTKQVASLDGREGPVRSILSTVEFLS